MRKLLALLSALASPALAQTPAGVINAPIYATGYISQVGGTNVTTNIPPQPNHPTNLNIYTTGAISGTWTIKLPNPAFEGQMLSFNCGAAANAISVTSSDGSSIDSTLPTACSINSGFTIQFDQRSNIWRNIGSNNTSTFKPFTGVASQWPWQLNTDGTWTLKQPDASDVTFAQTGSGAISRTVSAKLKDSVNVSDFGSDTGTSYTNAIASIAAGTVFAPIGYNTRIATLAAGKSIEYLGGPINVDLYSEGVENNIFAYRVLRGTLPGTHATTLYGFRYFGMIAPGSGGSVAADGAGDFATIVSGQKKDWATSSVVGEIGGTYCAVRNGGPVSPTAKSDASCLLANVGVIEGSGFAAAIENVTSAFSAGGGSVTKQINTQVGVIDSRTGGSQLGFVATASVGNSISGYFVQSNSATAYFTNAFMNVGWCSSTSSQLQNFVITSQGAIFTAPCGVSNAQWTLQNNGGLFNVVNNSGSNLFTVSQAGVPQMGLTGYVNCSGVNTPCTASSTIPVGQISGLGTGVATFLATPTSANLAAALTDETGTGAAVFASSPTLTTPSIVNQATVSSSSGNGTVVVSSKAASQALVVFQDAGVSKWQFYKDVDNSFRIYNAVDGIFAMASYPGGPSSFNAATEVALQVASSTILDLLSTGATVTGTFNATGVYKANGTSGVTCNAGLGGTSRTINGIVTTC